ncbi:MAG: TetR family transcriptional regulator [Saprospiraceae bacterium]|nr:TetR family transcriptional regulator [Saprospiraceae bacterium]
MPEQNTEEIIKETARKIFQEKGFEATRTRDIAEMAGINLALLNYYFRSKKKLYDIIMLETLQSFFSGILPIMDNQETSLREKIEQFVDRYIDMLSQNPDVPAFILNEARKDSESFMSKLGVLEKAKGAYFLQQFFEAVQKGEIPMIHPLHFMLNLTGMLIFPFLAMPIVKHISGANDADYLQLMQERKKLIPMWLDTMLKTE